MGESTSMSVDCPVGWTPDNNIRPAVVQEFFRRGSPEISSVSGLMLGDEIDLLEIDLYRVRNRPLAVPALEQHALATGQLPVRLGHHASQLTERDLRLPPEHPPRLRRVAKQQIDL